MSQIEKFAKLLFEWNRVHNLSGAKTMEDIYKNIDDSLGAKELLSEAKQIVDIGSGAGFPGLLLAIEYPQKHFVLTEPIKKKASFLKTAVRNLGLANVEVQSCRVEQLEQKFDFVVSRAVASTKILLEITQGVVTPQTQYLFYKGEEVYNEIEGLKIDYELIQNDKRIYLHIKEKNA